MDVSLSSENPFTYRRDWENTENMTSSKRASLSSWIIYHHLSLSMQLDSYSVRVWGLTTSYPCWHIFFFFGFLVGEWSIHINFSTSAAFCAFGDAWATATELRVKNATRFLLGTDVRIDHVLSVAILPSLRFSLPPFCSGWRPAARGYLSSSVFMCFRFFVLAYFLLFRFSRWWVEHSH